MRVLSNPFGAVLRRYARLLCRLSFYERDFGAGAIAASKISREKSERVLPAFAAALSSLSASPQGRLSGKLTRRSPSIRGRPIRLIALQFVMIIFSP